MKTCKEMGFLSNSRLIFFSTVWSFALCTIFDKLRWWGRSWVVVVRADVYQEKSSIPKVSGLKAFCKTQFPVLLFICQNIQCCVFRYWPQQNMIFLIKLILYWTQAYKRKSLNWQHGENGPQVWECFSLQIFSSITMNNRTCSCQLHIYHMF